MTSISDATSAADAIITIIHEFTDEPIIAVDAAFDALNIDSLDLMEIVIECEGRFDVAIDDGDVDRWETAGDLIGVVERLVAKESE